MSTTRSRFSWIIISGAIVLLMVFMVNGATQAEDTAGNVLVPLAGIKQVTSGLSHTCAVTTQGGVKCWGANRKGQLGDGTTTNRLTPTDVSGLSSGVVAISAGYYQTCAITILGGVKCWGANLNGRLGDGTTTDRLTPTDVSGLGSGVVAISGGYHHTCTITTQGGVKCWGDNRNGRLGDGTTTDRLTPTDVSGLSSGVVAISAGTAHTCAITTQGRVKCWGANHKGQLGDGTTTDRLTPTDVSGLSSGVVAVSTVGTNTCAINMQGGVKCWGWNQVGQLGDGTTTDRLTPTDVSGLGSGVVAISGGYLHTCAVTTQGGIKCWGNNQQGELGDGTAINSLTPTDVSGLSSGVVTISGGYSHTCVITTQDGVKCWGYNGYGELGDGTTTNRIVPVDVMVDDRVGPTPTPTSTPTSIPSGQFISGQVTDIYGNPVAQALVEANVADAVISANVERIIGTQTDAHGKFRMELASGRYILSVSKSEYAFDQSLQTVTVPTTKNITFVGVDQTAPPIAVPHPTPVSLPVSGYNPSGFNTQRIPLLLVHGWQMGGGYSCGAAEGPYFLRNIDEGRQGIPLGDMPKWFQDDGRFDVWIAYLETSRLATATFEENAECLRKQVIRLSNYYDKKIKIVAHSMGGLVSRACISNPGCGSQVDSLSTMGSPHGGIEPQTLIRTLGVAWSEGTGGFHPDELVKFNRRNPNRKDVRYNFIAGDSNTPIPIIFDWIAWTRDTINDGIVDTSSASGFDRTWDGENLPKWWSASIPALATTDEAHMSGLGWGNSYYSMRDGGKSRAYYCILLHIFNEVEKDFDKCVGNSVSAAQAVAELQSVPVVYSPAKTGIIESGQVVTRQVSVNSSGSAVFYMSWQSGVLTQTLINPSGQQVVPNGGNTYVALNGGNEMLPFSAYSMTVTQPGIWGIRVSAGEIPGGATSYSAFVAMESERILDVVTNCEGASCVITATLKNADSGISGADVQAVLGDLVVNLVETSLGVYTANITPNMEERVLVTVRATGVDDDVLFEREAIDTLEIVPQALSSVGIDSHEFSNNTLNFSANIQVTQPSTYTLYVQTHDSNGLVSLSSTTIVLEAGQQQVVLNDGGGDYLAGSQLSVSVDVVRYETGQTVASEVDVYDLTIPQAEEVMSNIFLPLINR